MSNNNSDRTILFEVKLENGQLKAAIKDSKGQLVDLGNESEKSGKKQGSTVDKLKLKWIAFGIAAYKAGQKIIGYFKDALKNASDLQETTNKFNVVFRQELEKSNQRVEDLKKNYFLSTEEARRFMGSIGDTLKPLGYSTKEASKLSYEITKLASDLGSFNNLNTEDVINDITTALTGEYQVLKKYGIVINENIISQNALAKGWDPKQLDPMQKAMIVYNKIVSSSTDAIGDLKRSQDSWAVVQRRIASLNKEISADIGGVLMAEMQKLGKAYITLASDSGVFVSAIKTMIGWLGKAARGIMMLGGYLDYFITQGKIDGTLKAQKETWERYAENIKNARKEFSLTGKSANDVFNFLSEEAGKGNYRAIEYYKAIKAQREILDNTKKDIAKFSLRRDDLVKTIDDLAKDPVQVSSTQVSKTAELLGNLKNQNKDLKQRNDELTKWLTELRKIGKSEIELLQEARDYDQSLLKKYYNDRKITAEEYEKYRNLISKKYTDQITSYQEAKNKETLDSYKATFQNILSFTGSIVSQLASLYQMDADNRIASLENYYNRQFEVLDQQLAAELERSGIKQEDEIEKRNQTILDLDEQLKYELNSQKRQDILERIQQEKDAKKQAEIEKRYAEQKQKLEEEMERRKAQIEYDNAKRQKDWQLKEIIIKTSLAVMETFARFGFPWGIAPAALVGALGKKQYGLTKEQEIPVPHLAAGGKVVKDSLVRIREAGYDETVLPMTKQVYSELGEGIAENTPDLSDEKTTTNNYNFYIEGVLDEDHFIQMVEENRNRIAEDSGAFNYYRRSAH